MKRPTQSNTLIFTCFLFGLSFYFAACSERYLYRDKVSAETKRGTVFVKIINLSPQILNTTFEEEVEECCKKRLGKEGFRFTTKNPQYELALEMRVDSSFNTGINYANRGTSTDHYIYSVISKGLSLNMEVKYLKTEHIVWVDKYELYFFNSYKRDLSRTKGVIKYMLSSINDEK